MEKQSKIFIAGHKGLVGSAIMRNLKEKGYQNLLVRERKELDLLRQRDVEEFFEREKIDYAFIAAAKVGGIVFNQKYQAEFLYENIQLAANVIHAASLHGVKKLL